MLEDERNEQELFFDDIDISELDDPEYHDVDKKIRDLLVWTINTSE